MNLCSYNGDIYWGMRNLISKLLREQEESQYKFLHYKLHPQESVLLKQLWKLYKKFLKDHPNEDRRYASDFDKIVKRYLGDSKSLANVWESIPRLVTDPESDPIYIHVLWSDMPVGMPTKAGDNGLLKVPREEKLTYVVTTLETLTMQHINDNANKNRKHPLFMFKVISKSRYDYSMDINELSRGQRQILRKYQIQ